MPSRPGAPLPARPSPTGCRVVGEFEALCSLASYAFENPDDPFPEIATDAACYDGEGLAHPLLPKCVPNDSARPHRAETLRRRVLIVSGSNMSGKSTFLRTVGVNAVLALAGAPVRARRLRLSPLAVGATLRIQDSLQEGRSRFYAEVLRMRQLVDLSRGPLPLLFLLDEIFAGTNSHDRRLGAESVVRGLVQAGAIGLVTTHDLSLTHIAEQLGPRGQRPLRRPLRERRDDVRLPAAAGRGPAQQRPGPDASGGAGGVSGAWHHFSCFFLAPPRLPGIFRAAACKAPAVSFLSS